MLHDKRRCRYCANDPEQCHADIECENEADPKGVCPEHSPLALCPICGEPIRTHADEGHGRRWDLDMKGA